MTDVMQTKPNHFLGCHAAPSDKILQCGTLNERTELITFPCLQDVGLGCLYCKLIQLIC